MISAMHFHFVLDLILLYDVGPNRLTILSFHRPAQLAGSVEYTDSISAEG